MRRSKQPQRQPTPAAAASSEASPPYDAAPLVAAPWCQLACYRPGRRGYAPHRDLSRHEGGLTALCYANPAWSQRDGGALRLLGDDGAEELAAVAPELGTLVLFRSPEVLHEVLPSRRSRVAFTLWAAPGLCAADMQTAGALV